MRLHVCLGVACLVSRALCAFGAVPRPNLIPLPQEVELPAKTFGLRGDIALVCSQQGQAPIRAGAGEIRKTLDALGGPAPLVTDRPGGDRPSLMIVLGTPGGSPQVAELARRLGAQITEEDPGPQGYVIRFSSGPAPRTVLLAGSDAQGALYACVTFCQMLRREGDHVVIDAVNVRDRPDFRYRQVGRAPGPSWKLQKAETVQAAGADYRDFIESMRACVDFCCRFKINYVNMRSIATKRWSHIQAFHAAVRAALAEASRYARERGIRLEASAYSAIDVGQGGPASELKDIVRMHGVGYCWSRDGMLRQQAREFGEFAREVGIGLYYLHAPDKPSLDNPSGFKDRCSLCKERWGEAGRAKADAHVMNIMYEEIRRLSPETRICAVLTPYGATLDRLDPERRDAVLAYWRQASSLLPRDMFVCVRENRRANVAAFKDAFKEHPVYFYIESVAWRGWQPFFATTPRFTGTFDFDDPRDMYYLGNRPDFAALAEVMAAHYAWNTGAPGAGLHRSYRHDPVNDGRGPPEVARDLVDAICSRLFGERAGPLIGEAVRGDVSWAFTDAPEFTAQAARARLAGEDSDIPGREKTVREELEDIASLMRRQLEGSEAGMRALRGVRDLARPSDSGRGEVRFDEWQRGQLDFMLSYYASVRALSGVRHPELAADDAILAGDDRRAERLAREGLRAIPEGIQLVDEVSEMTAGEWYSRARRVREKIAACRARLQLLLRLSQGIVLEEADTAEALEDAVFVLRGRKVTPKSSSNTRVEFTERFARTPGQKALLFIRPQRRWGGAEVLFETVDIRPFVERNGYLRFYVNSTGHRGGQRVTFWCTFRRATAGGAPSAEEKNGPWVYLQRPSRYERGRHRKPGYVDIDRLPATWQLVSIPLKQLVGGGHAYLIGFHLNFAEVPEDDLVIADPYLIGDARPVTVERRRRR